MNYYDDRERNLPSPNPPLDLDYYEAINLSTNIHKSKRLIYSEKSATGSPWQNTRRNCISTQYRTNMLPKLVEIEDPFDDFAVSICMI